MKKGILTIVLGMFVCMSLLACSTDSGSEPCDPQSDELEVVAEKPVIYLYGYDNDEVNIKLDVKGTLTTTYPKYDEEKGWKVTAKRDATLVDLNKQTYSYLYWEGVLDTVYDFSEGFCIKGSDTASFLEKRLRTLGLTRKEANEFIIYWLPKMEKNNFNVISFQTKAYTDVAKLEVEPAPDKMFRVFMAWYGTNNAIDIKPQDFNVPTRTGRVLVEWGGAEVNPSTYKATNNATSGTYITDETIIEGLTSRDELQTQAILLEAANRKQQLALMNAVPGQQPVAPAPQPSGHYFVDKYGSSTTFTDAEWNKLKSIWAYTGQAEELITHHTISELRGLLK